MRDLGSSSKYQAHLFKARDLARGDVTPDVASKLLLSVYGLKVLADPLTPNDQVREAASAAWEELASTHQTGSPLQALVGATERVFARLLGDVSGSGRSSSSDDSLSRLLADSYPFEKGVERVIPKLVRHVQQLWWFESEAERGSFIRHLVEATLLPTAPGWARNQTELTSSSAVNATLAAIASHWTERPPRDVYDPAIGMGGSLLEVARTFSRGPARTRPEMYGQDLNAAALFAAAWNLAINDVYPIHLGLGHVLLAPKFLKDQGRVRQFDLVVSTPPLGVAVPGRSAQSEIESDPYNRFQYGLPSKSSSDWLFAQHALASTKPGGMAIVVTAPGSLFRGAAEEEIRRKLIMADQVSAAFLLPSGLIPGASIQAAVLVLEPSKPAQRKGLTWLVDLTHVEQQDLDDAAIQALAADSQEGTGRSITVSLDGLRDYGYSLLPTPYLPPRDVRAALANRGQAKNEIESALADLEQELRRFNEAMEAIDTLTGRKD